jgi:hypothetical protein
MIFIVEKTFYQRNLNNQPKSSSIQIIEMKGKLFYSCPIDKSLFNL